MTRIAAALSAFALTAPAFATASFMQVRLTGDSSPAANSLSNVYLLAWFEEGGSGVKNQAMSAWSLSDAAKNGVNLLDVTTSIERNISMGVFDDPIGLARYTVVGTYEDGGVSVSLLDSAFIPGFSEWGNLFQTSESTVQSWLQTGDTQSLCEWFRTEMVLPGFAPEMGYRASQVDFSIADVNGTSFVEFAEIPAPSVLGLGGVALLGCVRRRR
ncbi:MAG: hypothetical protein JNM86_08275 [Phycisphaerae bacterium]|nr:hypothetical protein [Phycisphaerae bacterium]MBN8597328.1 hypothetical protein [Planctomycetota bacterium]